MLIVNVSNGEARKGRQLFNLLCIHSGCTKSPSVPSAGGTWQVSTRRSANHPGSAQTKPLRTVGGDKVPVAHIRKWLGKAAWVIPPLGKGKPICGTVFAQGPGCTWWVIQKDQEIWCVPQGDLTLEENNPRCVLYDVGNNVAGTTQTDEE